MGAALSTALTGYAEQVGDLRSASLELMLASMASIRPSCGRLWRATSCAAAVRSAVAAGVVDGVRCSSYGQQARGRWPIARARTSLVVRQGEEARRPSRHGRRGSRAVRGLECGARRGGRPRQIAVHSARAGSPSDFGSNMATERRSAHGAEASRPAEPGCGGGSGAPPGRSPAPGSQRGGSRRSRGAEARGLCAGAASRQRRAAAATIWQDCVMVGVREGLDVLAHGG